MKKFQNRYRIDSARARHWDYGWNAAYFVTICTKGREYFFGNFDSGKLSISEIGKIACTIWETIPERFVGIKLDEFILMPNHLHGIIIIDKPNDIHLNNAIDRNNAGFRRDAINRVSTKTGGITGNQNPMLHVNLSRIIRWYKGRVTFESQKTHAGFAWQSRFYDHIIRDEPELNRIRLYIEQNPAKWDNDRQNPEVPKKCGEPESQYQHKRWMV